MCPKVSGALCINFQINDILDRAIFSAGIIGDVSQRFSLFPTECEAGSRNALTVGGERRPQLNHKPVELSVKMKSLIAGLPSAVRNPARVVFGIECLRATYDPILISLPVPDDHRARISVISHLPSPILIPQVHFPTDLELNLLLKYSRVTQTKETY
jgi:hypothetical protein